MFGRLPLPHALDDRTCVRYDDAMAVPTSVARSVTTLADAVPARDRTITVEEPFATMLPDGGLQRGRVVGCDGPAAVSLACSLVAGAVRAGSWLLVLGAPVIGLEALAELGVPLRRVVSVETDARPSSWAERLAAGTDGFELIVTVPPQGADRVERKVRQRLQARGAVVLALGGGNLGRDLTVTSASPRWVGIGHGHGRLLARQVDVEVAGRRIPRPVQRTLWLPGPDGRVREAGPVSEVGVGPVVPVESQPHEPASPARVAQGVGPVVPVELLVG